MNSKYKAGLGKSFSKIFGEDKIKEQYKKEILENKDEVVNIDLTKKNNVVVNLEEDVDISKIMEEEERKKEENEETKIENNKEEQTKNETTHFVKISLLQPNKNQPRKNFDENAIKELAESIKKYGIIEPIIVNQNGVLYDIVAGERRWRAGKIAGLDKVPVVIKNYKDAEIKEIQIIENIQRENLNPVEEALAYQSLIDEYKLTQEEVAKKVSKNRATITNALRILKLNKDILDLIKNGNLSSGHARSLLSIEDEKLREKIAKRVIDEKLSVRDIEQIVRLDNLSKKRKEKEKEKKTLDYKQLQIILKDIEKKLKTKLNTKVKIIPKDEKEGKIEIDYYSKEDLDKIFLIINSFEEK